MLLRDTIRQGHKALLAQEVPSAQLAADLLLMHVLGCDRAYLHAHAEEDLPAEILQRYAKLIEGRAAGKPTQYLTGHQEFWGLDFEVTPDVLIPRPETEHVVERIVELAKRHGHSVDAPLRIVDVGTGSGCIALAVAAEFHNATVYAVDISPAALDVATRNAERLGFAQRVTFLQGDLLTKLLEANSGGEFDFILSNPPYVGKEGLESVQREVREFEPALALGTNLDRAEEVYERLFPQALEALKPTGSVIVELGYNLRDRVLALLGSEWNEVEVTPDLAGIPRVLSARKMRSLHSALRKDSLEPAGK